MNASLFGRLTRSCLAVVVFTASAALAVDDGDLQRWLDGNPSIHGKFDAMRRSDGRLCYRLPFASSHSEISPIVVFAEFCSATVVAVHAPILTLPDDAPAAVYRALLTLNAEKVNYAKLMLVGNTLHICMQFEPSAMTGEGFVGACFGIAAYVEQAYDDLRKLVASGGTMLGSSPGTPSAPSLSAPAQQAVPTPDAVRRAAASVLQVIAERPDGVERGSGFVVGGRRVVLSARHVTHDATRLWVVTDGGRRRVAAALATGAPATDVDASLLVAEEDLAPALRVPARVVESNHPGDGLWAVGYPDGDANQTLTYGIVAGFTVLEGVRALKTTTLIRPGSSGCPLLNQNGEVLALAWRSEASGFHYGVLADELEPLLGFARREGGS